MFFIYRKINFGKSDFSLYPGYLFMSWKLNKYYNKTYSFYLSNKIWNESMNQIFLSKINCLLFWNFNARRYKLKKSQIMCFIETVLLIKGNVTMKTDGEWLTKINLSTVVTYSCGQNLSPTILPNLSSKDNRLWN